MKTLMLISAACFVAFTASCRTDYPLNPNTMKPVCKCEFDRKYKNLSTCRCGHGHTVHATK